ncbi:MAG: WYL domain-containing protein [Eubacterium sp.]|nr:WYL domain-containing protein [Eubacterium sp.]
MSKGANQKLKMLYLVKIFMEETDDEHELTLAEIIERLKYYEVNADRKTLYLDFKELERFGLEIIGEKKQRNWYYHLGSRDFELPELKLLVDSVQAAKFITDKKSDQLINKLEKLVSNYQARKLHRQVVISGRIKSVNETIFYNVDMIHEAINNNRQIQFKYFRWNIRKEMELRRDGDWYEVSPFSLMWDDENYYLIGYDSKNSQIRHYRVDKMLNMSITEKIRKGNQSFRDFNLPNYSKSLFGMFAGKEMTVTLVVRNDMVGVFIDRFGKDITIVPVDKEHFRTSVTVAFSRQFLGWVFSLGDGVKITGPDLVVKKMKEEIERLQKQYGLLNQ